ncbi:MAG: HIT family protein [Candidatus Falkowbacteria bacterium]
MCIFCKIVNHEIPCHLIYEDDKTLVFLDIKPVNPGHLLVLPKMHYANIEETPADVLADIILVVKKMGKLLKDKLGVLGYNVMENNDPIAGQGVPHLHFHVIPRHEGDGHVQWPQSDYAEGEAGLVAKKLIS